MLPLMIGHLTRTAVEMKDIVLAEGYAQVRKLSAAGESNIPAETSNQVF